MYFLLVLNPAFCFKVQVLHTSTFVVAYVHTCLCRIRALYSAAKGLDCHFDLGTAIEYCKVFPLLTLGIQNALRGCFPFFLLIAIFVTSLAFDPSVVRGAVVG
jgi:hypothetical protein